MTKKNKKTKSKKGADIRYRVDIAWSAEDECYVANVPELPNCMTHGETMEEAVAMAKEAIGGHIETLEKEGLPVPIPLAEKSFSGKIALRIDPLLHRDIVFRAQLEGLSINKFVENKLRRSS